MEFGDGLVFVMLQISAKTNTQSKAKQKQNDDLRLNVCLSKEAIHLKKNYLSANTDNC